MNATMLKSRPLSGEFEEIYFDFKDEFICVKFEDHEYLEYCGIFGGGFGSYSNLMLLEEIALIVSFGQGYIFNINNKKVIHKTEKNQLACISLYEPKDYFIACSQIEIFVFSPEGLAWSSKRVSSDGIEIEKIINGVVYGKVYDFTKWVGFKLDLNTFEYSCDWQCEIA